LWQVGVATPVPSHATGVEDVVSLSACPSVTGRGATGRLQIGFDKGTVDQSHPTLRVSPPQCTLNLTPESTTRAVMIVRNDAPDAVLVFLDVIELAPTASGNSFVQPETDAASMRRARQQFQLPADRVEIPAGMRALVPFDVRLATDTTSGIHAFCGDGKRAYQPAGLVERWCCTRLDQHRARVRDPGQRAGGLRARLRSFTG